MDDWHDLMKEFLFTKGDIAYHEEKESLLIIINCILLIKLPLIKYVEIKKFADLCIL